MVRVPRARTMTRFQSLDALRGFAVMGILLMNIIAFAMPDGAYISPAAYGGTSAADIATWMLAFVLVDSKMRALFSILFGASMLLVYERAEATGEDGATVHFRRMVWLLLFGLTHFYFVWSGDILTLYSLCGLIGIILLGIAPHNMKRTAIILFAISFCIMGLTIGGMWAMRLPAGVTAAYASMIEDIVPSSAAAIADAVALHQSSYAAITYDKLSNEWMAPLEALVSGGFETLGLMVIGMILLRNGFLTGEWDDAAYAKVMRRAYAFGIPPLIGLALWGWGSGFDPLVMVGNLVLFSIPFSFVVAIGHAALALRIIKAFSASGVIDRVGAAGRMAFSNYVGTSLLMTTLFYGYGCGWYGELSRARSYIIVPIMWALILLWSKPWLDRYHYGPLEWLWRSAARGQWEVMRK